MLEYVIESELFDQGFKHVCGVDEAGRGPLCGPVVAAACILPMGLVLDGLNDSKKLTEKKRDELFDIIKAHFSELIVCNGNDNAVCILNVFKLCELNAVFVHCIALASPRINNDRLDLIFSKALDNIFNLRISRIGAILLKG